MLDRRPLSDRPLWLALALALSATAWVVAGPIAEAHALRDRLSPVADPFSESNALRGASGYLALGWTSHAGLPETTFGGVHPEEGDLRRYRGNTHVDTHYPPGAMFLTALMKRACGEQPTSCLRALPIAVSALGALTLAFASVISLGPLPGVVVTLGAFLVPLYSNMMLGLHYQGYALALLSMQLAALLMLYSSARPLRMGDLALLGGLGFLQGWLSFDYFFLVALAPVPIAVSCSDLTQREAGRRALGLVAAGAVGFALAHAVHFLQVVAYYGDFTAALRDLLGVAVERSDPTLSALEAPPPWIADPWMISSVYLFVLSKRETYFGFSLGWVLVSAIAVTALLKGVRLGLPGTRWRLCVDASSRWAWAIVAGVIVSCAWISVMPGHAHTHPHFVPRHLFLSWFVMLLALTQAFRLEEHG